MAMKQDATNWIFWLFKTVFKAALGSSNFDEKNKGGGELIFLH